MPKSFTVVAAASTFTVKRGPGVYYGAVLSPAAGGTVQMADLSDLITNPTGGTNINAAFPSSITAVGPFPTTPLPQDYTIAAVEFANGLTVALSSTTTATIFYS